jgi:hypothetical protein
MLMSVAKRALHSVLGICLVVGASGISGCGDDTAATGAAGTSAAPGQGKAAAAEPKGFVGPKARGGAIPKTP